MTKASDNEFPSLLVKEGSAPSSPAAGDQRLYIDTADHKLKRKNSGGSVTTIEGSAGLADEGVFTYLDATDGSAPADPSSGYARIYSKSGRIYSRDSGGTEYGPFDAAGGGGVTPSGYTDYITAEEDLLYYWPLNEAAGSTTFNEILGGTDMTATGTPPAGGPPLAKDYDTGGSVGINMLTGAYVSRAAITWPSAFTFEAWIFAVPQANQYLVKQWNGAGAMIYCLNTTNVRFYSGGSFALWTTSAGNLIGRHHIALAHDGTHVFGYWDGVQVATDTFSPPSGTDGESSQQAAPGMVGCSSVTLLSMMLISGAPASSRTTTRASRCWSLICWPSRKGAAVSPRLVRTSTSGSPLLRIGSQLRSSTL